MFVSFRDIKKGIFHKTPSSARGMCNTALYEAQAVLKEIQKKSKTHCSAVGVRKSILIVSCPSSSEASEFRFVAEEVISEINTRLGSCKLSGISYKTSYRSRI